MITPMQALLARTMLNLSQQDAALRLGWAHQTLSKLEKGSVNPPASRLRELQSFYENGGIEFLDGDGVRRRGYNVVTYEGRDGFAQFRKDLLEAASTGDADMCQSNVDERLFDKWGAGEVNDHYRSAMADLRQKFPGLRHRTLSRKNDTHFSAKRHSEYRWVPENEFGDFPLYVYGHKTAMIMFEENDIHIFIINHPKITKFYREQFNRMWEKAEIPDRN